MYYAINVADLTAHKDDFILQMLVGNYADRHNTVEAEPGQFAGVAVPLTCGDEQAAAIARVIRKHYKKHQLRVYESKTGKGGWRRI